MTAATLRTGLMLAAAVVLPVRAAQWTSSGIEDIDYARRSAASLPTSPDDARERYAVLVAWFRLLLHQGVDVTPFEEIRRALGPRFETATPQVCATIDRGYRIMEDLQARMPLIPLVQGTDGGTGGPGTNWPSFHGNPAQTGFTADPGPTRGRVAWKFPIGHTWYARPSIENGRVYIASPGLTTLAYCLDQATGKVIWKARQWATQIYETPRVASPVVMLKDHVMVRETGSRGETGIARDLVFLEKATGKVTREINIGHTDYRRGYAPVAGNDEVLVYPYGQQYIENVPPLVWMFDTMIAKDTKSGRTLWMLRVGEIHGEPVLERDRIWVATESGTLYCLSVRGPNRIVWQYDAKSPLRGTPLVTEDSVYIGAGDGVFHAIDKQTGKARWSSRAGTPEGNAFQYFSAAAANATRVCFGTADRRIHALDAASGRPVWSYTASDWIRSRPLLVGNTVVAAAMDGTIIALEDTGREPRLRWKQRATSHQIFADLAGGPQGVLASTTDLYLCSLRLEDGTVQWKHSLLEAANIRGERVTADMISGGADFQSSPTAVDGRVYAGAPNRFVYAMDAASGKELWRFETSGQVSGTPLVAEGKVFFGQQGGNKEFYAVDAASGRLAWKRSIGWTWVGARYVHGKVIAGTVEGDVVCLRAENGDLLWKRETTGGVYPSPASDGKSVYTGAWGGHYYSFDVATGAVNWAHYIQQSQHPFSQRLVIAPDSGAPLLLEGKLIASVGRRVFAIDTASGELVWETPHPRGLTYNATPSTDGKQIFVGTLIDVNGCNIGSRIIALDAGTGQQIWEQPYGGGITASAVARDRVCFGSTANPHFTCVDAQGNGDGTTTVRLRVKIGGVIEESSPAIYGNRAYVLTADRALLAIE